MLDDTLPSGFDHLPDLDAIGLGPMPPICCGAIAVCTGATGMEFDYECTSCSTKWRQRKGVNLLDEPSRNPRTGTSTRSRRYTCKLCGMCPKKNHVCGQGRYAVPSRKNTQVTSRHRKVQRCSRCGELGHKSSTCQVIAPLQLAHATHGPGEQQIPMPDAITLTGEEGEVHFDAEMIETLALFAEPDSEAAESLTACQPPLPIGAPLHLCPAAAEAIVPLFGAAKVLSQMKKKKPKAASAPSPAPASVAARADRDARLRTRGLVHCFVCQEDIHSSSTRAKCTTCKHEAHSTCVAYRLRFRCSECIAM